MRRRVPELVDLVVDRRVLLDVGVRRWDIGFGLVVVVVRDEILDRVVREELLELVVELRGEGLVRRHHERRTIQSLDHAGDREGLPAARHAEQRLVVVAALHPRAQLVDRRGLVARRLEVRDELEGVGPCEPSVRCQRGPSGVSTISIPSAASSSRIRSAVAQSLASRAACRSASRPSIRGSASHSSETAVEAHPQPQPENGIESAQQISAIHVCQRVTPRHVPDDSHRPRGVQIVCQSLAKSRAIGRLLVRTAVPSTASSSAAIVCKRCKPFAAECDRIVAEGLLLAVVGLQEEIAEGERIDASVDQDRTASSRCPSTWTSFRRRPSIENSLCIQIRTQG